MSLFLLMRIGYARYVEELVKSMGNTNHEKYVICLFHSRKLVCEFIPIGSNVKSAIIRG